MKGIKVVLVILLIFLLLGAYMIFDLRRTTAEIKIQDIAFTTIKDDTYEGEEEMGPIHVITKSHFKNGKIEKIDLVKHTNGLGGAREEVINNVIEKQSLNVDTISGATTSSKIILKSIENAIGGK